MTVGILTPACSLVAHFAGCFMWVCVLADFSAESLVFTSIGTNTHTHTQSSLLIRIFDFRSVDSTHIFFCLICFFVSQWQTDNSYNLPDSRLPVTQKSIENLSRQRSMAKFNTLIIINKVMHMMFFSARYFKCECVLFSSFAELLHIFILLSLAIGQKSFWELKAVELDRMSTETQRILVPMRKCGEAKCDIRLFAQPNTHLFLTLSLAPSFSRENRCESPQHVVANSKFIFKYILIVMWSECDIIILIIFINVALLVLITIIVHFETSANIPENFAQMSDKMKLFTRSEKPNSITAYSHSSRGEWEGKCDESWWQYLDVWAML